VSVEDVDGGTDGMGGAFLQFVRHRPIVKALHVKVPRQRHETESMLRRRRIVVLVSLIVGSVLLGFSLTRAPDSATFYPLSAALALTWFVGGFASGPLHLGHIDVKGVLRRPFLVPVATGLLIAGIFCMGALVVREIDPLRSYVQHVVAYEREGSTGLVVLSALINGLAEEVFFRGAVYAALPERGRVALTTTIYALVTLATGNPLLTFAAATVGTVLALQRRASGGVLAPSITHVTWSICMLATLPVLFR